MAADNENDYYDNDDELYDNREDGDSDTNDGEGLVEIYSKKAIFWFTLFFTTIFGGVMLAINLRKAGLNRGAVSVMLFAVGYYFLSSFAVSSGLKLVQASKENLIFIAAGASVVANLIGGLILTGYYFKNYFPDDDYYPRSIQNPLIIALLLFIVQSFIARYIGIGM